MEIAFIILILALSFVYFIVLFVMNSNNVDEKNKLFFKKNNRYSKKVFY